MSLSKHNYAECWRGKYGLYIYLNIMNFLISRTNVLKFWPQEEN